MIVRPKPRAWELVGIWRLSILPRIAGHIVFMAAWAVAAVAVERRWPALSAGWNVAPFTLLGIALSIFLGFRNGACYDRWWEARRQLGAMLGEQRSLARMLMAVQGGDRGRRERMVRRAIDYSWSLMAHLQGESVPEVVDMPTDNVPDAMLREIGTELGAMLADGEFGEVVYVAIETRLLALAGIQGACERIKGTPTPFSYTLLLHRTAYLFCLLLPWGMAGSMGWLTPLLTAVVAYAFFGLDALGDELEEPFGMTVNALPLAAMATTVERSLLEAIGERELPALEGPVNSVLR